jgi:hypothetical protein
LLFLPLHGLHFTQSFSGGLEGESEHDEEPSLITTGGSQSTGGVSGHGSHERYDTLYLGPYRWSTGSFGQGGSCLNELGDAELFEGGKSLSPISYLFLNCSIIIYPFVLASYDLVYK